VVREIMTRSMEEMRVVRWSMVDDMVKNGEKDKMEG
jgi:hypothetical protein